MQVKAVTKLHNKTEQVNMEGNENTQSNFQRGFHENSFNETTTPEILIITFLAVFLCIVIVMFCLASKSCITRFLIARQRLRKAMQYRPSKYKNRVTPMPDEHIELERQTPLPAIFKIT